MDCGSMGDVMGYWKIVESHAEVGGLACEVSEGSLETSGAVCYFGIRFYGSG